MDRILTVTLNPALDAYYYFDRFRLNKENGPYKVVINAGGKGVNVSRALNCFGVKNKATGMCSGKMGLLLKALLKKEKIAEDFFYAASISETRTNITLIDKTAVQTRILEPGPRIDKVTMRAFESRFTKIVKAFDLVVFSGRLANGAPVDTYKKLIRIADKNGVKSALDTSGEALRSLAPNIDILKVNRSEAEYLVGHGLRSNKDKIGALQKIRDRKIGNVIVTLGRQGAVGCSGKDFLCAQLTRSFSGCDVGCGDAFLAGFLFGSVHNFPFERCLRWAVASGTANLLSAVPGQIAQNDVYRIEKCVKVFSLTEKHHDPQNRLK